MSEQILISPETFRALQQRARMLDDRLEVLRRFFSKNRTQLAPVILALPLHEQLQLSLTVGPDVAGPRVAAVGKTGPLLSIVPPPPDDDAA